MSNATSTKLQPLDKTLRGKLEQTVKEARDVAEQGARAAVRQLEVGLAKVESLTNEEDKELRRRLRIHGRQLGDTRDPKNETQQVDRLVEEIAYEHWHRMLFARFLAENHLLMYPDPDDPVPVSVDDCNDLAAEEGARNGWELAARFAAKMLPQIFRVDSPVFALTLPPEKQQRLEQLLAELPPEVFKASDSLGWVYQFWQAEAKKRINESEVKIGARELPAVTQLFTEPYMVSFLLDNSLGAWWAARRLTEEDLRTAQSEQQLREKAALPGVPLEYLRFVRVGQASSLSGDTVEGNDRLEAYPTWTPAAGTFDAWPESLSELKTLDPCCGSGHFLVAALLMLAPMRMELEGLSAKEAVDRVLSENLHGLEIDQRCVELAAFALALAAWRFPEAGGYRVLPDLNVACCGLSVSVAKEEWKALAKDDKQLKIALDWMYDEFKDAPVLGSLLNPARSMAAKVVEWDELVAAMQEGLHDDKADETREAAIVAHGLSRAAILLSTTYNLAITNVPYLSKRKQSERLLAFCEEYYETSENDLATVFLERCLSFGGTAAVVLPQNWLFLSTYRKFREKLLRNDTWNFVARLGPKAFSTPMWDFNVQMMTVTRGTEEHLRGLSPDVKEWTNHFTGLDVSDFNSSDEKAVAIREVETLSVNQQAQLARVNSTISFEPPSNLPKLSEFAVSTAGIGTGDSPRFYADFWQIPNPSPDWESLQATVSSTVPFDGRSQAILWENEAGSLYDFVQSMKHLNSAAQRWRTGQDVWANHGVIVNCMGDLSCCLYSGDRFDQTAVAIVPKEQTHLPAIWAFCESGCHSVETRKVDQKINVTPATMVNVPFDLAYWQQVASEKYPHGLPEPYSDDPTQWIFHGHPASSDNALQVAVARLLGYRWPTELDAEMELATDARAWIERNSQLTDLADNDGIVCIPAVGTELPAEDRLLNLLHKAYEDGRAVESLFREKLEIGDESDPLTLDLLRRAPSPQPSPPRSAGERGQELPDSFNDWVAELLAAADHKGKSLGSWLREKFFTQHCKLFHHRPFIWHIWDGLRDGFSVLVNYHRLDTKMLQTLIYTYLENDWIRRQKQDAANGVDGSEEKLAAAEQLKLKLVKILEGESPLDIFVRWKPLEEQPIGWNPDLNDGVRLNIRPWLTVGDVGKRGAGVLRDKPNIKWTKDRGKDVESAPWYHLGPEYKGKEGDRINDHHLTLAEKAAARKETE